MEVCDEVDALIDLFCSVFPTSAGMELSWTFILTGNPSPCVGKLQIY
jgi:hypothetical protein